MAAHPLVYRRMVDRVGLSALRQVEPSPATALEARMTPHDAATRERVAKAIADNLNGADWRAYLPTADAALSALQPPPKGWEVSDKAERAFRVGVDSIILEGGWLQGDEWVAGRKAGLRGATPHLLRDFADGVSIDCLRKAWLEVFGEENGGGNLRDLLRSLADTLEGKA